MRRWSDLSMNEAAVDAVELTTAVADSLGSCGGDSVAGWRDPRSPNRLTEVAGYIHIFVLGICLVIAYAVLATIEFGSGASPPDGRA